MPSVGSGVGSGVGVGVGSGVGVGVGSGVGVGVGSGVGVGVGSGVGVGVGSGVGVGVGSGVGVGVGSGVGVGVGSGVGVGVGSGVGVGVGSGVGVGVGSGVAVASSVLSSMEGGRSPTIGDSLVGSCENMPAGAVGDASGPPPSFPQAVRANSISTAGTVTASLEIFQSVVSAILALPTLQSPRLYWTTVALWSKNICRYSVAPSSSKIIFISLWQRHRGRGALASSQSPMAHEYRST